MIATFCALARMSPMAFRKAAAEIQLTDICTGTFGVLFSIGNDFLINSSISCTPPSGASRSDDFRTVLWFSIVGVVD